MIRRRYPSGDLGPCVEAEPVHDAADVAVVTGSFQSFLEALRGHEVITLQSTPAASAPVKEGQ